MLRLLFAITLITIYTYSLIDCARTPKHNTQALPKTLWIIILSTLPLISSTLWFTFGKTKQQPTPTKPQNSPDDNQLFLQQLKTQREQNKEAQRLKEWENKLKNQQKNQNKDN